MYINTNLEIFTRPAIHNIGLLVANYILKLQIKIQSADAELSQGYLSSFVVRMRAGHVDR